MYLRPGPCRSASRQDAIDFGKVLGGQLNLQSVNVFFKAAPPLGAGNGNDVISLSQHPSERELRWGAAFYSRQAPTSSTRSRFRWKFAPSPVVGARSSTLLISPVRNPRPSGL